MTGADIERVERELEIRLPRDYREVLLTRDDLRVLTRVLGGVEYPYFLDSLYLEPDSLILTNKLERKAEAATEHVFPGWWRDYVLIGSNGAGEYFCVRLNGSPGLWFLSNDSGEIRQPYGTLGEYIEMRLEQYRSEKPDRLDNART